MLDVCGRCGLAVVPGDQGFVGRAEGRVADGDGGEVREGGGVLWEVGVADEGGGAAGLGEEGDLRRGLAEVGGDVGGAQAEAGEHLLEHGFAVARLHEDAVALRDATGMEGGGEGVDAAVQRGPGRVVWAVDEGDLGPEAAGVLAHEMGEVHDPARDGDKAAFGGCRRHGRGLRGVRQRVHAGLGPVNGVRRQVARETSCRGSPAGCGAGGGPWRAAGPRRRGRRG